MIPGPIHSDVPSTRWNVQKALARVDAVEKRNKSRNPPELGGRVSPPALSWVTCLTRRGCPLVFRPILRILLILSEGNFTLIFLCREELTGPWDGPVDDPYRLKGGGGQQRKSLQLKAHCSVRSGWRKPTLINRRDWGVGFHSFLMFSWARGSDLPWKVREGDHA